MANTKPVDKSKKSNIKCEHCKYFVRGDWKQGVTAHCKLTMYYRNYWNRCKSFEWAEKYNYN